MMCKLFIPCGIYVTYWLFTIYAWKVYTTVRTTSEFRYANYRLKFDIRILFVDIIINNCRSLSLFNNIIDRNNNTREKDGHHLVHRREIGFFNHYFLC